MQWLAEVCVRRPVFTWVLVATLTVVGLIGLSGLGVSRFPDVQVPYVVVTTIAPGSSPRQVESEITDRIEEAINGIGGLELLESRSLEGASIVVAEFRLEVDLRDATQQVRDRVGRMTSTLPANAEAPQIEAFDPTAAPVVLLTLRGPLESRELGEIARTDVRRRLETVPGVASVTVVGGAERQFRVVVDLDRASAFGLSASDVAQAIAAQNVEAPGGMLSAGERSLRVRVRARAETLEALRSLALTSRGGTAVRLGDIADVIDDEAPFTSLALRDGEESVVLAVRKRSGSNTVAVVDAVRQEVSALAGELPHGVELEVARDESEYVRHAVSAVGEHLIVGALLAALTVLLFLRSWRATVIAALAIPTSIVATFALIRAAGLALDTMTLLGLTLSVGIVIDDAIVVLENIARFIEEKALPPMEAAIEATREIGLAVLATTLSLVAVFLPVGLMGGLVGRFLASFGLTMSFAILVSMGIAFTLTPMLCARWLRIKRHAPEAERESRPDLGFDDPTLAMKVPPHLLARASAESDPAPEPRDEEIATYRAVRRSSVEIESRLERAYVWTLAWVMEHRWAGAIAIATTLLSTIPLLAVVPGEFIPAEDESRFEVTVRAPEGQSLEATGLLAERVARAMREMPEVVHTITTVGSPPGDPTGRAPHEASIYVELVGPNDRAMTQQELMSRVRREVFPTFASQASRLMVGAIDEFGSSGADAAPIQYVLRGPDVEHLAEYAHRMLDEARQIPGTVDHGLTLEVGSPELSLEIDTTRAVDLGVRVVDVANVLQIVTADLEVGQIEADGRQVPIVLGSSEVARSDPARLSLATVTNESGQPIPLAQVVRFVETRGPGEIARGQRQRQVRIFMGLEPGASEDAVTESLDSIAAGLEMDPGYRADTGGRAREQERANEAFQFAFGMAIVFMYLVLAAQFGSWIHPITILASLPLTIPFALFSIAVTGQSLNVFTSLGLLVLFGIVKKNSILQVDHVRALRRKGMSRAEAILVGNRERLRPILMTTLAFVAGMAPLVISSGAGAATNHAIAIGVMGGQTLSLGLTLLVTPVIYSWLDDLSHMKLATRLFALLRRPRELLQARTPG
ncbi:efflux RND transporter permease subunit [Sandaracinus amylolyticus]|uniref:efflux RND transporter permease subunit n=1 Tax=Sandaracinus amylolyticus TaxID=927083 RepID=UPI001F356B26|nr:efflux RND transporter permease subunit [Sandaracinus amylolyticus]UJR84174.1 Hypothetical protein I5071_62450 [Sandaracinus amylolyticus]